MTTDEPRRLPALTAWAEVDPARYPFDPVEMPAVVRTLVPPAPPPPAWRDGGWTGCAEARAWVDAVSVALAGRYGPWAYGWDWTPGETARLGKVIERIHTPAETPTVVADSLLSWRCWLERLAERFDQLLRSLRRDEPATPDNAAGWEAAIAQLMTTAVAGTVEYDCWIGYCGRVLIWFLNAAGVPADRANTLVNGVLDDRFDDWALLTAAEIVDAAERLTREVLGPAGIVPAARVEDWPDTWPQDWPSWRATNLTGNHAGRPEL